tara:strand:- start:130 stop:594 length:465 start_codon:yes stop_codon:yes gene_type:complete
MSSKLSVVVVKSKSVDSTSDLNKMVVHLEQVLTERENVEIKIRQTTTDALVKSADFIIFSGWDSSLLSSFFHALSLLEKSDLNKKVFLFDEPGTNCWTDINRLLTFGMDIGRIDSSIFDKVIDCWNYRDIMSYIDLEIRKLEKSDADSGTVATV